jgi:ketosteroid isomerase-like protein
MSSEDTAVVDKFLAALSTGDIDTVFNSLAPDGVVDEGHGLPFSGRFVGQDGAQQILAKVSSHLGMVVDSYQVYDSGPIQTATLVITYTSNTSGKSATVTVAELYTVVDGKITYIDVYYKDPAAVMALVKDD